MMNIAKLLDDKNICEPFTTMTVAFILVRTVFQGLVRVNVIRNAFGLPNDATSPHTKYYVDNNYGSSGIDYFNFMVTAFMGIYLFKHIIPHVKKLIPMEIGQHAVIALFVGGLSIALNMMTFNVMQQANFNDTTGSKSSLAKLNLWSGDGIKTTIPIHIALTILTWAVSLGILEFNVCKQLLPLLAVMFVLMFTAYIDDKGEF